MKKLFTLLTMLVIGISVMWGQTTTATYGKSNGTFYDADDNVKSGGFDAVKFVTNSTPAVTITVSVGSLNSADAASGARLGLNNGTNKFTLSVPSDYIIVSYSFNCKAVQTAHPERTLTTESGTTLTIPSGNNSTRYSVSETYVNKQSTYFIVETTGWSPINTYNFTITVRKKFYEDEITVADDLEDGYYVVQGRANSGSGFWYHDKSLTTRYFRISTSSDKDLTSFTENLKYVWKLTKDNENGTFTLKNVDTEAYAPADEGKNYNFTGSTPANFSWDSEHAAIKQTNFTDGGDLYVHCNKPSGDMNLSYWNSGPGESLNVGSASLVMPRFFKIPDDDVKVAIAKKELQQAISDVNDFKSYLGDGTGKYTTISTLSEVEEEIGTAETLYGDTEATYLAVTSETATLQSYIDNATINQPTPGYYRIQNKATSRYVNCTKVDDTLTNTSADTEGDNDAMTIFYIDTDKDIQAYDNGAYWKGVYRMGRGTFDGGTYGTLTYKHPWQFVEGNSLGTYKLIYGNDTEGKYHATGVGEVTGYANLNSEDANADKATWTLIAVTELPARTEGGSSERGNEITIAPAGTEVNENVPNVLVETSTPGTYTCNNLQLTDDVIAQFTGETNLADTKVTYKRSTSANVWGTICLPYATSTDGDVSYYRLVNSETSNLRFEKVTDAATTANEPYLIKKAAGAGLSISAEDQDFTIGVAGAKDGDTHNGFKMQGVLVNTSVIDGKDYTEAKSGYVAETDANAYYFDAASNTFRKLNGRFNLKAFRAYLTATSVEARANIGVDVFDDDQPTGISFIESEDGRTVDVVFDLDGRRLQDVRKGINIINGKKVIK